MREIKFRKINSLEELPEKVFSELPNGDICFQDNTVYHIGEKVIPNAYDNYYLKKNNPKQLKRTNKKGKEDI